MSQTTKNRQYHAGIWRKAKMIIDEQFDSDEILRDPDERYDEEEEVEIEEEMRELNFGTLHDQNANFSDMASDLDAADDLWE
jgi:hypothetical protein